VTPEGSPGYVPIIDIPRSSDLESLPLFQEVNIPDAQAFFRISPVWLNPDPGSLLEDGRDLALARITMEHGADYWLAHQGMEVLKYKKTPQSPTWYYARTLKRIGVHACIQEVSSEIESLPHHHKIRNEQLNTLYGVCVVRVGDVDYLSTPSHQPINFPTNAVHSVRTNGSHAVNVLVIRGPGDCSSQDDHHHEKH